MTREFHKFWLMITAFVVGSFGPVFFLGTMPATDGLAHWTLDLLSWPLNGGPGYDAPSTHFLSALTGGFLIGWCVMIWELRRKLYDIAPEAVRQIVLTSVLSWFVLDSAGSIASGNASNAVFNVVVLLIGVGPLWRKAREA